MMFKYIVNHALKGQNHQHRATPCDWMMKPFQALKGRNQASVPYYALSGLKFVCASISSGVTRCYGYKAFSLQYI